MALSQSDAANLATSIKSVNPDVSDADLANVIQLAGNVNNDPAKTAQVGDMIHSLMTPGNVTPGNVSTAIPASYVAPAAPLDPFKGTGTTASQVLGKQFGLADQANATVQAAPTMATQAAAEQAYQQSVANNAPARTAANFVAATGGPQVSLTSNTAWDNLNAQNKDLTLGAATRAQDFAKGNIANIQSAINAYQTGVTTAGNVLDQMDKSGRFQIDANAAALNQKKLQLDLIGSAATASNTQALMDPSSDLSLAARLSARKTLQLTGLYTPQQIAQMVPDSMTGIAAAPIAAAGGTNLDNIKKLAESKQALGAAAASYGAANQANASAQKSKVETAGIMQGQQFNQSAGMAAPNYAAVGATGPAAAQASAAASNVAAPSNAAAQTAIARQGGTPTGPTTAQLPAQQGGTSGGPILGGYQMQPTVSPTGETSWQTSTQSQQAGRETATALADATHSVNNYNMNGGKTAAQLALVQAPTMGGVNLLNTVGPMGNAAAAQYGNAIDKLNADAIELGLLANKTSGGAGSAAAAGAGAGIAGIGTGGARILGTGIAAGSQLFNGGQPVTAKTDPQTVQKLAIAVQEARLKQQAMIPYYDNWQRKNGGSIANAIIPDYITKSQTMINPATGEVQVAYDVPSAISMKSQGWVPKEQFFTGKK